MKGEKEVHSGGEQIADTGAVGLDVDLRHQVLGEVHDRLEHRFVRVHQEDPNRETKLPVNSFVGGNGGVEWIQWGNSEGGFVR